MVVADVRMCPHTCYVNGTRPVVPAGFGTARCEPPKCCRVPACSTAYIMTGHPGVLDMLQTYADILC